MGDVDMPNLDGIERFWSAARRCGYFARKTFDIIVPARFAHCEALAKAEQLRQGGMTT